MSIKCEHIAKKKKVISKHRYKKISVQTIINDKT